MAKVEYTDWICRSCKGEFRYEPGRPNFCPYCRGQELYRPDVLDGLSINQRMQRVAADTAYLLNAGNIGPGTDEANAAAHAVGLGDKLQTPKPGETPVAVLCARVDLNTPIFLPDNIFASCADCGCDLQVRPDAPAGARLCISCGARRAREAQP